jgi:hypothetical protein
MNAIGNHEEERGTATTAISAAVIIGDKADVHRSRVQNPRMEDFDIHDRVNYAAKRSFVRVRPEEKVIALELEIDTLLRRGDRVLRDLSQPHDDDAPGVRVPGLQVSLDHQ